MNNQPGNELKNMLVLMAGALVIVVVPLFLLVVYPWMKHADPGEWSYTYGPPLASPSGKYLARTVLMTNRHAQDVNIEVSAAPTLPSTEWTTVFDWGLASIGEVVWTSDGVLTVHGRTSESGLGERVIEVRNPPLHVTFAPDN